MHGAGIKLNYDNLASGMNAKARAKCLKEESGIVVMKVCHLSVTQSDTVGEGRISVYVDPNSLKDTNGKILQARIAWEAVSYSFVKGTPLSVILVTFYRYVCLKRKWTT